MHPSLFAYSLAATRAAAAADPALQLHGTQKLVMPWHDDAQLETNGKVAQFKCTF